MHFFECEVFLKGNKKSTIKSTKMITPEKIDEPVRSHRMYFTYM